ncbi:Gfo/Idh/MocA family oxidoreductase [Halorubrum gandharaense]
MTWRVVGANFDQMHMNTNLEWVVDHPKTELVGVCDETPADSTGSVQRVVDELGLPTDRVYDSLDQCLEELQPDVVIGCPKNADHANFVERVAPHNLTIAIEKPLATTLADADRMLDAVSGSDSRLFINWPVLWDPVKHAVKRLVEAGTVGDVQEVQYYGGNAGAPPDDSWFYDADAGGGSLLDYLCYGATFATWFRDGDLPTAVTAETYSPPDMEVDVQSATVCRYETGLSTFQTSWRMVTNPWETPPQPAKGYEIVGTHGSISTRERSASIRVQTNDRPEGYAVEPDSLAPRFENVVAYLVDRLETGAEPEGPADPAFCREAHRIVETARKSARTGNPEPLAETE